ncbi:MAG: hydrogenase maturation protease [Thermoanaerobaculum sp.]
MLSPPPPPARILVVGVGNVLLADDGVGVLLARELATRHVPQVEVLDGGTLGLALLPYLEGRQALVLLDAMRGEVPGELQWLSWPLPAHWGRTRGLSPHEGSALELLAAAELTGSLPPQVWLGVVTAGEVSTKVGLSQVLEERFPRLLREVEAFVLDLEYQIRSEAFIARTT